MGFKVYFDFTCPFSYDFRKWIDAADLGYDIGWRCFLMAQAARPEHRVFDDTDTMATGLVPLLAFARLRMSGEPRTDAFHRAVLQARFEQGLDIDDPDVVAKIGSDIGVGHDLIMSAFGDRRLLEAVASEHEDAVVAHNMRATPTIVTPDHENLYVRLGAPPQDEATARRVVKTVVDIALAEPAIRQLRRS